MLNCDRYLMPETLEEALAQWAGAPEGSRLLTGGTDILPWAREGRAGHVHLPAIIDISRVKDLHGYEVADGRVRLGANMVFQRFLTDETLRHHLPCMPHCAVWFADDQIREQATLAGNIVNASPAADGTPPILAMNGTVEIARLDGGAVARRSVAIGDFIAGPGGTTLKAGEIVTAVTCDSMAGYGGSFEKVGQRRSLVISVVCAAGLVKLSPDKKTFADLRLAMGGIGPVPVRLDAVETFLKGQPVSRKTILAAVEVAGDLVRSRTRREYRGEVIRGFIERAIEDALADCGVALPPPETKETTHAVA